MSFCLFSYYHLCYVMYNFNLYIYDIIFYNIVLYWILLGFHPRAHPTCCPSIVSQHFCSISAQTFCNFGPGSLEAQLYSGFRQHDATFNQDDLLGWICDIKLYQHNMYIVRSNTSGRGEPVDAGAFPCGVHAALAEVRGIKFWAMEIWFKTHLLRFKMLQACYEWGPRRQASCCWWIAGT